jgi:hypothetical protein
MAVTTFSGEVILGVILGLWLLCEWYTEVDQPLYACGAALYREAYRFLVAETGASGEGVLHVSGNGIARVENRRDSTLCIEAGSLREWTFCQNGYPRLVCQAQSRAQPGDSRPNDENVVTRLLHHLRLSAQACCAYSAPSQQ